MTRKTVKRVVVIGLIVVGLVSSYMVGTFASELGWKEQVEENARVKIGEAGFNKKNELIEDIDNVVLTKIQPHFNPAIAEKEDEVEQALEAYFNTKVDEVIVEGEPELQSYMETRKEQVITMYQAEIDAAFAGQ